MEKNSPLKQLIERFPEPLILVNKNAFFYCNQSVKSLLGDRLDPLRLFPDHVVQKLESVTQESGVLKGEEISLNLKDKEERHIAISGVAVGGTGLFLIYDLTEIKTLLRILKNSRDKFRTVLDALQDIVFVVDNSLKIQNANLAAAQWLNEDIKNIIGKDCTIIYEKNRLKEREPSVSLVKKVFDLKEPQQTELKLNDPNGEQRWFLQLALPIFDDKGQVRQVAIILQNIHDQKEKEASILSLNKELKEKNDRLEKLIKRLKETQAQLIQTEKMASIGQLAAGVAHEINNPVGFVNSNVQTLRDYVQDILDLLVLYDEFKNAVLSGEKAKINELADAIEAKKDEIDLEFLLNDIYELLEQSEDGLERVKKIVQDLKDFSHVDQAELKEIDINSAILSTLNVVWNELKYKANVKKELSEDIPLILGFPQKLNQVFMNILVNAAQAIEDRGEIKIVTRKVEHPRLGVEIEISDTGCGMTEEVKQRIFDAFFTTKPVGKGTGLGLNIAYKIVKAHKGEIRVSSQPGKGTTMTVFLPVLNEEEIKDSLQREEGVASVWMGALEEELNVQR
ncbi:Circadian input kinase A [Dissulfuribacter thermophilus]|uniref:histidine kinase n=1 Tax=Dissulfuribacter thermophilus TaxID=1156395 RepID=A0A1B9F9P0_9BACT|nr:ATP-binding protein [Dissulfuribacter thermophilus]OCC16511.1 Circadian input kinase A [Dissulfuribacter thermophilus]